MFLSRMEIPVAHAMISALDAFKPDQSAISFLNYICLWSAYNNIYATIAARDGINPNYKSNPDGTIKVRANVDVQIPAVSWPPERELIDNSFNYFPDELKNQLLKHESTTFFVRREPRWQGIEISHDATGQTINGVINVGHTTDIEHPVWAPISIPLFDRFVSGGDDIEIRNKLAYQLLYVLYTIRNNLVHAGKQPDDANDVQVVDAATPLLKMIVDSFMAEAA